jgi:energy-coupling factor transporter ATP-binding protein EcfA2
MTEEPVKYITKFEIQGLFGRYDIEWNLHPDVNVLAGVNGSGKTTILDCIYTLISEKEISKSRLNMIEEMKISFDTGFNISHPYIAENKKESPSSKVVIVNGEEKKIVYAELTAVINHTPISSNIISTFDTELDLYGADIRQRSDKQVKTELDLRLFDLQKEYLNYQVNLGKKLKANKGNLDDNSTYFQDKFLEIIDNLFSETNKKVNRDKNELEFLLGDKEINAYQLSSGEKQLLIILLTVLVQDNKPAILLMDEPEISLHFEWQENLINYIRELNPNAQLIIATHSADIIMKGWGDRVFELSKLTMKDRLAS